MSITNVLPYLNALHPQIDSKLPNQTFILYGAYDYAYNICICIQGFNHLIKCTQNGCDNRVSIRTYPSCLLFIYIYI